MCGILAISEMLTYPYILF